MSVANVGRLPKQKVVLFHHPTTNACHRVHKKGMASRVRLERRRVGILDDLRLYSNVPADRLIASTRLSSGVRFCSWPSIAMAHMELLSRTMTFRYQRIRIGLTGREQTNPPMRLGVSCSKIVCREAVAVAIQHSAKYCRHHWM